MTIHGRLPLLDQVRGFDWDVRHPNRRRRNASPVEEDDWAVLPREGATTASAAA